jgi:hyaluronan synthase
VEVQRNDTVLLDSPRKTSKPKREFRLLKQIIVVLLFLVEITIMLNINFKATKTIEYYIGAFATVSFIYLTLKLVLSFFYKPATEEPKREYKVSAVIPSYNESADSVKKTIECLLEQDYPLHEIIFIDDGSSDPQAFKEVQKMEKEIQERILSGECLPNIITHKFKKNRGKKKAQAWGFKRSTGDIIMLADSDGYIYPNAVRELLKPFNDEKVTSVVGHINARNVKDNIMTQMQDIMYQGAFRVGRAAQSITNCVLVCSGALSLHRRHVVINNLDEFLNSKALGIHVVSGDDRLLTLLSLKSGGKTKYQSTAQCVTDVPITVKKFFKQQVRWAKSAFLFTLESMKYAWKRPFMMFWLVGEGFLWFVFVVSQLIALFTLNSTVPLLLIVFTIGYFCMSSLMSGIYYVLKNPIVYLFVPFYSLIRMFLSFPIKMWALLTIRKSSWGTR